MIDPSMDRLVEYLMKVRGETQNPMMPPQAVQPEINPAVAQILQLAQGQNPMMADSTVGTIGGRFKQIQDAVNGPATPVSAPTVTPEAQYVKPSNVIRIGGVVKRWDDTAQDWIDMSPEDAKKYTDAGGTIRE